MRLRALDQIHISSVKTDVLHAGEEFDVSDDLGRQLLDKHPRTLVAVGGLVGKAVKVSANKAESGAPSSKSIAGK